jgi:hypothetical protein
MGNRDEIRKTIRVVPVDEEPSGGPMDFVGLMLADKYRLERLLGAGGMGSVYLATHQGTGRYVAVKLIAPQFTRNAHFVERFKREARAAGRLRHPSIVDVTDFGFAHAGPDPVAYLVMEYLDGCTLGEVLAEERRLPVNQVVAILQQVCAAVHAAHQQGVIHRDLKPENIWLQPNSQGGYTAKVLDFGIAKLADGAEEEAGPVAAPEAGSATREGQPAGLTLAGAVLGTPLYMSPEQCRGETLDARSDVYSLGVIAYQLLCGSTPFEGEPVAVMEAHRTCEPLPLRQRHRKMPRSLAQLVMSALDKQPDRRPATAIAFGDGLRVRADGLGRLYRRAFALYSEYFPAILAVSLVAHVPLIVVTVGSVTALLFGPREGGAREVIDVVTSTLKFAANAFTSSTIGGLMALIVSQLEVAPLKALDLRSAFGLLRRRWRPFFKTAILASFHAVGGLVLLVVPGIYLAASESMWAPVVLMEGLETRLALKRSRELARRSLVAVLFVFAVQISLPVIVESLTGPHGPGPRRDGVHQQAVLELWSLSSILLLPLLSIVPALLYLKMRQMGGETLDQVVARVGEDLGVSNWEQRVRARLVRPKSKDSRNPGSGDGPSAS